MDRQKEDPAAMATSGAPKRGLIIGCGIAGPVVAMFLRRIGIEAAIYE